MSEPKGPLSGSEARRREHTNPKRLSEDYIELRRQYSDLQSQLDEAKELLREVIEEYDEMGDIRITYQWREKARKITGEKKRAGDEVG